MIPKIFDIAKLIPIEILLSKILKKVNKKQQKINRNYNFKRVKRSCKYHTLWFE